MLQWEAIGLLRLLCLVRQQALQQLLETHKLLFRFLHLVATAAARLPATR